MKKIFLIVVGFTCVAGAQDMRENLGRSLFADQKANRVGDAITVLILESSSAVNGAKTSTSRASDLSLGAKVSTGAGSGTDISGGVGTGNQFKGEGSTSNTGSVRGKLSAHVDSVLANGNLVINGSRSITVNGEEQIITVSGIVRPSDIMADNSVYSFNISDAKIVVQGDGNITKVQEPGWLTKVFHWLF
ncbi:MAG: flagellar basal body L-ring protein FlgH [Ignavibacteriae bacterium]|nr:flagellar basal body L-ring protein FlgH [Ignavibacteriota bacterium]